MPSDRPSIEERIGVIANAILILTQKVEALTQENEIVQGAQRDLIEAMSDMSRQLLALRTDLDRLLAGEPAEQWQMQLDRMQEALGLLLRDLDRRDGGNGAARKALDVLNGEVLT